MSDFIMEGAAFGLSDEDVIALLKLIRAQTDLKVVMIQSVGKDAEVQTGFLASGEAGEGLIFKGVRTDAGWRISETSEWIA
jgi:hypothetical protein